MIIINLVPAYIQFILKDNDLESYEKEFPKLFKHYFFYWANRKLFYPALKEKECVKRVKLIKSRLLKIEKRFIIHKLSIANLKIVLFVGQNTTNGHAFKYKNEFIVWIPIEAYATVKQVDTFITHEIVHAIHYSKNSEFYFKTKQEKDLIFRKLITEGIATRLTARIQNISEEDSLWADYIDKKSIKKWMSQCNQNKEKFQTIIKKSLSEKNDIENQDFFSAADSKNIFRYRGGYFAGLKLIQSIIKTYNVKDEELLVLNKRQYKKLTLKLLSEFKK